MTAPKKRRFPTVKGCDHFGVFPQWIRPDDWCKVPFTHTITQTTCHVLPYFNPGSSLYLVEDRAPQSGEMFIWCQKSYDGFPTASVWGRFMASTAKGDKVLTTMGDVVVLPLGPAHCQPKPTMRIAFALSEAGTKVAAETSPARKSPFRSQQRPKRSSPQRLSISRSMASRHWTMPCWRWRTLPR
jgi:hypothetical protein